MSSPAKLTVRRGHRLVSLVLALALMSAVAFGDDGDRDKGNPRNPPAPTGIIRYPCGDPTLTKRGVTPNGMCGYMFTISGGTGYTIHPRDPADLDVYFYDADGGFTAKAGPPAWCGDLSGTIPSSAVKAVVVSFASGCSSQHGGSLDGSQTNVKFDYIQG